MQVQVLVLVQVLVQVQVHRWVQMRLSVQLELVVVGRCDTLRLVSSLGVPHPRPPRWSASSA